MRNRFSLEIPIRLSEIGGMRENCYLLRIGGGSLGALFLVVGILAIIRGQPLGVPGAVCAFGLMLLAMAVFAPSKKLEKWFGGI